jgi:hypothetical protein
MRTLWVALVLSAAAIGPGAAACYSFGCTGEDEFAYEDLEGLKCSQLWQLRNIMYDEAGYCFKTTRAKKAFDNSDCEIDDMEDVELSDIEYANIAVIQELEADKGC